MEVVIKLDISDGYFTSTIEVDGRFFKEVGGGGDFKDAMSSITDSLVNDIDFDSNPQQKTENS